MLKRVLILRIIVERPHDDALISAVRHGEESAERHTHLKVPAKNWEAEMDIYEYAMQLERDSEKYYRELVEKTKNKGLRTILTMLADADVEHYNTFQKMKKNESIQMVETEILSNVKTVFARMRAERYRWSRYVGNRIIQKGPSD